MLRVALITASLLVLALPVAASSGSVVAFNRASAIPNGRVKAISTLKVAARLYLVNEKDAAAVRSRTDRRLSFIGVVKANRSLTFSVPPLDAGTYRLVVWNGTLVMPTVRLHIRSTPSCPVTPPNRSRPPGQPTGPSWYGNGLLWAGLDPDGVYTPTRGNVAADGSIFNKLAWVTTPATARPAISGERIDAAAPPLRVRSVNLGSYSNATNPSFMSAVDFPTAGCWRLRARVGDVSLTYVVRVVVD